MPEEEDISWLTVRDVAEIYRVSEDLVYRAIREKRLIASRLGERVLRIKREDAQKWSSQNA